MVVRNVLDGRRGLWRSRWAAIGAAVAISLGGGGLFVANAASSVPSSVVTITPERVLDTRTGQGLSGVFQSLSPRKLQITGWAVPVGATGVLLNVTVVGPSAAGFLSVRPGDASGVPSTSSLNFQAGDVVPNSVQVALPTSGPNAGQVDITYDAYGAPGNTTHVLADVVGYMIPGGGSALPSISRTIVNSGPISVGPYGFAEGGLLCPGGSVSVGTGFSSAGEFNSALATSYGMSYYLTNNSNSTTTVAAQVICMSGVVDASTGGTSALTDSQDAEVERVIESVKQQYEQLLRMQGRD